MMKLMSDFRSLIALRSFSNTFDSVLFEHVSSLANLCLPFPHDATVGAPPAPNGPSTSQDGCSRQAVLAYMAAWRVG